MRVRRGRLERLECPECGCVFGPLKYLRTPEALVSADYALLYSFYSEGDSTEEELRAFDLLKPTRDRLYLNWGSGAWSRSVEILRAQGYDVWGYEPNAQTDSPFVVRRREEVSARFDGIFSNNVIEHLFSPLDQFLDFRTLLKPDGRMVHASPCYEWSFAFTRFHVFFPLGEAPFVWLSGPASRLQIQSPMAPSRRGLSQCRTCCLGPGADWAPNCSPQGAL